MSSPIRAAGVVLWQGSEPRVAVVHRPRYDDWSLPKGKLDPGETIHVAAARETVEETGFTPVLGRYLRQIRYTVDAVPKTVDYFSARVAGGRFEPNDEVDELRWLTPAEAEATLTRPADVDVVRDFAALPAGLTTVLLVRHAKAGKRDEWTGDDDLRPLSDAGVRQAQGLRVVLGLFGPDRVVSAPRLRCVRTVSGVAADAGVETEQDPWLSEEVYWRDPDRARARFVELAAGGGTPLVCSQGKVIPDLVASLARRDGVPLPAPAPQAKKGSLWLLSFLPPTGSQGPRLAAATYFASPLPTPLPTAP
ncbi:NUDIX hydrolase [Amycolatopsis suaedae]|uniref:NUDIX hydrolase n=1 Tax=Amycolatopsis suaedae TaxID=2510978 RepID=A0A4Q7JA65_9PSEU|nr:NUDIX hydrolase [Amycolatopsis suaedae]RZQ64671.1 NUDIX hydrolase [Amycolatopsis suaedae]